MEQPDRLPLEYRVAQNEKIEAERKAWHECKRNESDEWREAYEFLEAQEKRVSDQMAEVFRSMNTVTNQLAQGSAPQPLRQEPEPTLPQPLRQEPDPFNSPFAFGVLALMFLDTEAMQKAIRRMELCKEIFDADMEFRKRLYPISGWEV
jgi:hypothetical protein